jgi:hypothetical protein
MPALKSSSPAMHTKLPPLQLPGPPKPPMPTARMVSCEQELKFRYASRYEAGHHGLTTDGSPPEQVSMYSVPVLMAAGSVYV